MSGWVQSQIHITHRLDPTISLFPPLSPTAAPWFDGSTRISNTQWASSSSMSTLYLWRHRKRHTYKIPTPHLFFSPSFTSRSRLKIKTRVNAHAVIPEKGKKKKKNKFFFLKIKNNITSWLLWVYLDSMQICIHVKHIHMYHVKLW